MRPVHRDRIATASDHLSARSPVRAMPLRSIIGIVCATTAMLGVSGCGEEGGNIIAEPRAQAGTPPPPSEATVREVSQLTYAEVRKEALAQIAVIRNESRTDEERVKAFDDLSDFLRASGETLPPANRKLIMEDLNSGWEARQDDFMEGISAAAAAIEYRLQ